MRLFEFFLFFKLGHQLPTSASFFHHHWSLTDLTWNLEFPKFRAIHWSKVKLRTDNSNKILGLGHSLFLPENIPLISTLKWLFPRSPTPPPRIKDVLPDRRFPRVGNLPIGNKELFNKMSCRLNIVIQFGRRQGNESSLSAGGEFSGQKGNFSIFIVHHRPLVFWSAQNDQNKMKKVKNPEFEFKIQIV